MNRLIFFFYVLFFAFISSCNTDDDSRRNRFSFGENTFEFEKAYYIFEDTDFNFQEFLVVLTDGSIESFSIPTNDFVFSPETQNVILLRARTFDEEQVLIGRLPTGNFEYSVPLGQDSVIFLRLQQACQTSRNDDLQRCLETIDLPFVENSSGVVEIISLSSQNDYEIKVDINFSGESSLSGTYSGSVLTFNK